MVYAINHVATDGNSKPLTNVVLQSVIIRRVGAAAEAFDIHAQGLPKVTGLHSAIARSGGGISLSFTNQLNVDNRLFYSADLLTWEQQSLGIETEVPVTNKVYGSSSGSRRFFRMAQVDYGTPLFPPRSLSGRSMTIVFTEGETGTLGIDFTSSSGGSYTYNDTPGTLYQYIWKQEPYNGRLWPIGFIGAFDVDVTMILKFDAAGAGTMTGTVYPPPYYYGSSNPNAYSVKGTFTIP